jgi:hypothetical protein
VDEDKYELAVAGEHISLRSARRFIHSPASPHPASTNSSSTSPRPCNPASYVGKVTSAASYVFAHPARLSLFLATTSSSLSHSSQLLIQSPLLAANRSCLIQRPSRGIGFPRAQHHSTPTKRRVALLRLRPRHQHLTSDFILAPTTRSCLSIPTTTLCPLRPACKSPSVPDPALSGTTLTLLGASDRSNSCEHAFPGGPVASAGVCHFLEPRLCSCGVAFA